MKQSSQQLLTDFYQLTMAYGYWKTGRAEMPAVFHLYFRSNPFHGGYTVVAGLQNVIDWLDKFSFAEDDLAYLQTMKGPSGTPLFEKAFLDFLRASSFQCHVEALPEGTIAFPNEPIVKVRGPIWQAQWVETFLLNAINFQSLIATKACRIVDTARGAEVMEFGLRRAQGGDGALSASRAAFIGGASATSNLLAGKLFGIPLRGTHAHSWVMSFDSELEAFEKYADCMPDQCTLLVDTYDTRQGIEHAITIGKALSKRGKKLSGVRLDSGDLAYLSQEARRQLDSAGLKEAKIVASNELDEYLIQSMHLQGACIDAWGVGTKLVTAQDQPAMSGVYKLAAVFENGAWHPRIKVSDQTVKTSNPGVQCIRRFFNSKGEIEADLVYDESEEPGKIDRICDPIQPIRHKRIDKSWESIPLLVKIFDAGKRVYQSPTLPEIQAAVKNGLKTLHPGHRRLENPHVYPVGLSPHLHGLKTDLIRAHSQRQEKA